MVGSKIYSQTGPVLTPMFKATECNHCNPDLFYALLGQAISVNANVQGPKIRTKLGPKIKPTLSSRLQVRSVLKSNCVRVWEKEKHCLEVTKGQ